MTGPAGRHGLPVGYQVPAGTSTETKTAIGYAISKLGDAYVWGAAGPNQFDCSGLTMMAWRQTGVTLVHYTVTQEHEGRKVPASQIAPGDLVLVPGADPPGPGLPGHVGIYLGYSLVLSAIDPQYGVAVQSWKTFTSGGLDAIVDPSHPPAGIKRVVLRNCHPARRQVETPFEARSPSPCFPLVFPLVFPAAAG